jgi:predicted RNA-binding Zn ribbon-like protein
VPLEGGHLALDFVNTIGGLRVDPPSPADELLDSYEDLVVWCVRLGVFAAADGERLTRAAADDEKGARRTLRRAKELRGLIYAIFRPIADGQEPPAEPLDELRDAECNALASAHLTAADAAAPHAAMDWTWPPRGQLADPLFPITHAAVELLTTGPLEHLKICGNCRWLFLDQSRNGSRLWCSMNECGGRSKMRRYRARRATRR